MPAASATSAAPTTLAAKKAPPARTDEAPQDWPSCGRWRGTLAKPPGPSRQWRPRRCRLKSGAVANRFGDGPAEPWLGRGRLAMSPARLPNRATDDVVVRRCRARAIRPATATGTVRECVCPRPARGGRRGRAGCPGARRQCGHRRSRASRRPHPRRQSSARGRTSSGPRRRP